MIGGTGERRTLRTLAMYGDIMNVIAGPERIRHLSSVLAEHCEAVGRNPDEIRKTVHVPIAIVRDEAKARKLRDGKDWSMIGSPQYVVDRIGDFLEVGIEEFIPQIRPQKPEIYEELDEEVFAAFVASSDA
jgi:alkanesulfonate monooxygenase SsuD/methylene tetrahydromethanopterin reductase-like flavin-dependent oxidoreductase (luciferase family)